MNKPQLRVEHLLYALALLIALAYRLIGLGSWPLSESEAGLAYGAYQLAQGESIVFNSMALAQMSAAGLFRLLGSNEFLARLLPALAGSLVVVLPFAWRERVGRVPAVLLAFGMAIEPSLVAASRIADGPMLGIALLLAAVTAYQHQRYSLAGVCTALALLCGPAVWLGLLIALVAWLLLRIFRDQAVSWQPDGLRSFGIGFGLTALFSGTWFLRAPQGLGGMGAGLFDFLAGWRMAQGVSLLTMAGSWLAYLPFSLLFAIVGLVMLYRRKAEHWLPYGALLLAAVLVVLIYPGRTVTDLAWLSLPALLLSATGLAAIFEDMPVDDVVAWAQMALVFCFLCFAWLDLASLNGVFDPVQVRLRLLIAAGVLVITLLSTFLVSIGWDVRSALRGLAGGYAAFLLVYIAGAAWTSTHLDAHRAYESWYAQPAPGLSDALLAQLAHYSETNTGHVRGMDVVYTVDSAGLHWVLRDFPEARYQMAIGSGELPTAVITDDQAGGVFLQSAYRGESFPWATYTLGMDEDGFPLLSWFFRRETPSYSENIVLWVRGDAFPSGSLIPVDAVDGDAQQPDETEEDIVPEIGE